MTLGQCLQLATVQAALRAGVPLGARTTVHPVGRDEDGDPTVVLTWPLGPHRLGADTLSFREAEPWE